jgi:hypothetical protein
VRDGVIPHVVRVAVTPARAIRAGSQRRSEPFVAGGAWARAVGIKEPRAGALGSRVLRVSVAAA